MKIKNNLQLLFLFLLFIIPINVFAYSKAIIPGGESVGIEVNSNGVLVVGYYKVNDRYIGKDAGVKIGDSIVKINDKNISNINEMINYINNIKENTVEFTVKRDSNTLNLYLELESENNILKTGLYVKDTITGIGTLTYIDPNTKIFGALGHEIDEKTTSSIFPTNGGVIFGSKIVGIDRGINGGAGAKNATYDRTKVFGTIEQNKISGIFGKYEVNTSKEIMEVGSREDTHTGDALIKTVITDDKVEDFSINIISIDGNNDTKNILFEVTDSNLLSRTGGIVQGMSGSPIIQDNKIIGAVTHVIVNNNAKGYGIFIDTMLKEGEN